MENPFDTIIARLDRLELIFANLSLGTKATEIEIIDRSELLKRLGISEPTAVTWGKRGKIPELRIGTSVRYNWPSVVAALETPRGKK